MDYETLKQKLIARWREVVLLSKGNPKYEVPHHVMINTEKPCQSHVHKLLKKEFIELDATFTNPKKAKAIFQRFFDDGILLYDRGHVRLGEAGIAAYFTFYKLSKEEILSKVRKKEKEDKDVKPVSDIKQKKDKSNGEENGDITIESVRKVFRNYSQILEFIGSLGLSNVTKAEEVDSKYHFTVTDESGTYAVPIEMEELCQKLKEFKDKLRKKK